MEDEEVAEHMSGIAKLLDEYADAKLRFNKSKLAIKQAIHNLLVCQDCGLTAKQEPSVIARCNDCCCKKAAILRPTKVS